MTYTKDSTTLADTRNTESKTIDIEKPILLLPEITAEPTVQEIDKQAPAKMPSAPTGQQEKPAHTDHNTPMLAGKKSRADIAIELMKKKASFFHTAENDAYAEIWRNGHYEVWHTRSQEFELWLRYLYYIETGSAMKKPDLVTAIRQAEAMGLFDGPELEVGLRVARHEGAIHIDLGNDGWEQIQITPEGWRVIQLEESPVKFRRPKGMLSLPHPMPNGQLDWVKGLLNLESDGDWCLIASWLLGAMKPTGPYPILILQGEQGSAKSTVTKMLRSLLDPSTVPNRTLPRTERDLVISAEAARILAYDNVSGIKDLMSDAFCRISTGGGFGTRKLRTDKSEELFNSIRPMIFNGISDLTVRHDFADRALIVTLPPIKAENRLPETVIKREWENIQPYALGSLCDAVAEALRNYENVTIDKSPRMADFAKWVVAAEPALPWQQGRFMTEYEKNRFELIEVAIESDPISLSVMEMMNRMEAPKRWEGAPAALLKVLASYAPGNAANKKGWPLAPNIFTNRLRRVQTFLRAKGIEIEKGKSKSGERFIAIRQLDQWAENISRITGDFDFLPEADTHQMAQADEASVEAEVVMEEGEV